MNNEIHNDKERVELSEFLHKFIKAEQCIVHESCSWHCLLKIISLLWFELICQSKMFVNSIVNVGSVKYLFSNLDIKLKIFFTAKSH